MVLNTNSEKAEYVSPVQDNIKSDKLSLLCLAAGNGNEEAINTFKKEGGGVDLKNDETLLDLASKEGRKDAAVNPLINQVASINVQGNNGFTPLHHAAGNGHIEIVCAFVENRGNINAKDSYGFTPLHYAAKNGHKEVVRILIEKGADISRKCHYGSTPLHYAAEEGHLDIVEALIEKGADVNVENHLKNTPLHLAARGGHQKIVNVLLQVSKIDVNVKGQDERTPLHLALENEHQEVVEDLIKKGAIFSVRNSLRYTALHLAANNGYRRIVENLTERGVDPDTENPFGCTPLHLAAEKGHREVVETLIERGANVNKKDRDEFTPWHRAVMNDHESIAYILMEKGTDINALDLPGCIPLHRGRGSKVGVCRSVVSYIAKLEAVGLHVSQENLRWKNGCIDSFGSENIADVYKRDLLECKEEVKKIKREDKPLYKFLKESRISRLVSIWEANVGNKFNNEESLREQYPKYANILINKANEVRKEIFLHNHKPLIDALRICYEHDFKSMTFAGIKNFFRVCSKDDNFGKDSVGEKMTLINYVDLEDTSIRHKPEPRVEKFAKVLGHDVPASKLDNPDAKQHRVISCCTIS